MTQQTPHPHFATQSRTVLSGSEKRPVAMAAGNKPAAGGDMLQQPSARDWLEHRLIRASRGRNRRNQLTQRGDLRARHRR